MRISIGTLITKLTYLLHSRWFAEWMGGWRDEESDIDGEESGLLENRRNRLNTL
jgi:hypothetical protein